MLLSSQCVNLLSNQLCAHLNEDCQNSHSKEAALYQLRPDLQELLLDDLDILSFIVIHTTYRLLKKKLFLVIVTNSV